MNKSQFIQVIDNKMAMLEESNITELMVNGNCREGINILRQIEYNSLTSYLKGEQSEKLEAWEIPKSSKITFIWYLWGSGRKAGEIMKDAEEWKKDLFECVKTFEPKQLEVIQKAVSEVM